jgi:predicted phosphodiesterase
MMMPMPAAGDARMRYLILSDIHANLTALEAVLDAAKGRWQKAICLGDLVGYGPDPNEVIERIRSLGALTIRGNHDKAVTSAADADDFNPIARSAVVWTRAQLRAGNREYLEQLPRGPLPIDDFSIVHGSLYDEDEYVFSPAMALDGLVNSPTPVTFFGHTHIQGGFALRDDEVGVLHFKPAGGKPFSTLAVEAGTAYLLNPGSVGQPRDGDVRAAFAIADLENQTVEFWRVPYNVEDVQKRMAQAGLPEPLSLRLSFGR